MSSEGILTKFMSLLQLICLYVKFYVDFATNFLQCFSTTLMLKSIESFFCPFR